MSILCPRGQNNFDDATEDNLIATLTLPSLSENLLEIEVIHDITVPNTLRNLARGFYITEGFGEILFETIESFFIVSDINNTDLVFEVDNSRFFSNNEFDINAADFCLSENIQGEITFVTRFQVRDAVCNIDGEQAISATWFPFIDNFGYEFLEIDYKVRRGEDGFGDDFEFVFTPDTATAFEIRNDSEFFTLFLPYSVEDLGFDTNADEASRENIFLFLGDTFFEDAPNCITVEINPLAIYIAFIICLIPTAISIVVFVLVIERLYKYRHCRIRQGNQNEFNLLFPGSPDIVLQPNTGEVNTVQAVLEADDPRELDAAIPINTIQVTLNQPEHQEEVGEEDDENEVHATL